MWHERYEPLLFPGAGAFAALGRTLLPQLLGNPVIPISELYLRRSVPTSGNEALRRDFRLCEIADRARGLFAIYVSAAADNDQMYGQLGHELGHLRDADVYDAYAEGLCTWFARNLFQQTGRDWAAHHAYFQADQSVYGATYQMMLALERVCGAPALSSLFAFAAPGPGGRKFIAIDDWLASIPTKSDALREILKYSDRIRAASPADLAFGIPRDAA